MTQPDTHAVEFPEGYNPDQALKLSNQLCFPLYATSKELVRRYKPYLDEIGLTYTQYIVMLVLWELGEVNVRELGCAVQLDSGTLTPLLKKLEHAGLVTRTRSKSDERQLMVALTEQGRALKQQAAKIPLEIGPCLGLKANEATQLRYLLDKVRSNVQRSWDE